MGPSMSARSFAPRPESVTVIAWLLIVFGGFGLMGSVVAWTMHDWPMMQPLLSAYRLPYTVVLAVSVVSMVLHMACAVAFLMRLGWARHVYIVSAFMMSGFSAWVIPWPQFVLPSLIFPVVATMFLYRPMANQWFAATEVAEVKL